MRTEYTYAEWLRAAKHRYGSDSANWRFVCPICGHVASVRDWREAGAPEGAAGFSCVGRWIEGAKKAFAKKGTGPCTYAGGGLIQRNPIRVLDNGIVHRLFAFADEEVTPCTKTATG